jgi:di/tricarboxylate transporter
MNTDLAIVLLLLAAAIVMFTMGKPRMDAVALLMLVLLPFTGVITVEEALAGFSDPNIVLIAALFVVGEALVRTGVAHTLGDALVAKAGGSETRLLVLLMLAVGGLGAVMSSTGAVAIFVPVVLRLAERTGTAPASLDDAPQRRRTHERHAHAGGYRAQPRRQQRTHVKAPRGFISSASPRSACRYFFWASPI